MEKFEQISLGLDIGEVKDALRASDGAQIQALLGVAKPLISAQAVYRVCYIEEKLEDAVIIDGIRFGSRVLRKNLENVGRVFPYVVTIGARLEQKADACEDLLEKYYLDQIGNIALSKTRKHLEDYLRSKFALDGLSYMSPGSLADWPIEEQQPLFSILKGAEAAMGVRLTESLLMIPRKSVSGIYFPTEVTFYSCQLCPRQQCEGRKARFNEDLAREYGILK
jgi:Vitamin B12 dependent methionine synthase, activation domain